MLKISEIKVEYRREPIGIDIEKPRFFWNLESDRFDVVQKSYQIAVTSGEETIWDSGEQTCSETIGIAYGGPGLLPQTRYDVRLTVTDNYGDTAEGQTFFETGLFCKDDKDPIWKSAKWIGAGDELVYYPHYLSIFAASYQLKICPGSTRAGFVFSANDSRLMDPNKNLYGIAAKKDASYVYVETDISKALTGGCGQLKVYRVGHAPEDSATEPFLTLELPALTKENAYDAHTYTIKSVVGTLDFYFDGEGEAALINKIAPDDPRPVFLRKSGRNINPMGEGGDVNCLIHLCDLGYEIPAGNAAEISDITIKNVNAPGNILYQDKTDYGILEAAEGDLFCVRDTAGHTLPLLKKDFSADKTIASARLYITARGCYEAYVNGKAVSEDWFNPGSTQFNKTHLYQTYDITDLLQRGDNTIGVILSEGWWNGFMTFEPAKFNFFGDRNSLLAKVTLRYADGSEETFVTDSSWLYHNEGPVRFANFFNGEVRDLDLEETMRGWNAPGYGNAGFKPACEIELSEKNAICHTFPTMGFFGPAEGGVSYEHFHLLGQVGDCVREHTRLTAVGLTEPRKGVYIYDMGQNLAGVEHITIRKGKKGQKLTLRFAEILYPDLPEYEKQKGTLMVENLRAALVTDTFTLREGEQVLEPHFTFHGFRYLEITGIDEALPLADVQAIALSSVGNMNASYETSNPEVNQLWSNISWSLRDNYISIPTDCPQRNERMGWSGDISVFSRSAVYMADSAGFFERHLMALRDSQSREGRFPDIAPIGNGFGGVLWGSAGITVPYENYMQYKDLTALREHYAAMKQYLDYLDTRIDPETGLLNEGPLGDWLGPEYSMNEPAFLWTVYHAYDLWIMAESAKALGLTEDEKTYRKKYEEKKAAFHDIFVDRESGRTVFSSEKAVMDNRFAPMMAPTKLPIPEKTAGGKFLMDTQTSYAVPLALGIFDDDVREMAATHLEEACRRENADNDNVKRPAYSLMTGFIGTAWISQALSLYGRDETAYRILQNGEYPSWIYPVRQGATTIWERLNSYTREAGFGGNNGMNSFNHYSFGAVAAWMLMYGLGIKREDAGFTHFTLCPTPDASGQMTYSKGYVNTVSGRISSSWEQGKDSCIYRFTIPANTRADVLLPAKEGAHVRVNGREAESLTFAGGRCSFTLGSGSYTAEVM